MTAKKAFLNMLNPAVKLNILRRGQISYKRDLRTINSPQIPAEGESEQAAANTQRSISAHIVALGEAMDA